VTPYYQDELVTIYHGDCLGLMDESWPVDALISDPPYGIGYSPGGGGRGWGGLGGANPKTFTGDNIVRGDDQPFDPSPFLNYPVVVLFGANHYAPRLPASSEWVVWDKRDGMMVNKFGDCELIWTNQSGPARVVRHVWNGAFRDSERGQQRQHPTQKPLFLMHWLIERYTQPGDLILDPFMGSGTTLVAAKRANRRAVGIEIDEHYCAVAAARCQQSVLGLGRDVVADTADSTPEWRQGPLDGFFDDMGADSASLDEVPA
jgi:site-specific DNA-methyltransferase (adenine-specific)